MVRQGTIRTCKDTGAIGLGEIKVQYDNDTYHKMNALDDNKELEIVVEISPDRERDPLATMDDNNFNKMPHNNWNLRVGDLEVDIFNILKKKKRANKIKLTVEKSDDESRQNVF